MMRSLFWTDVPVRLNLADLTQPETSAPVLGFTYITDDQPSRVSA
jgi:hypothetical protein